MMKLIEYYNQARDYIIKAGYGKEIQYVMDNKFENLIPIELLNQYVWVVVNSGMKNQVAEKIFERFFKEGIKAIGHPGKRKAIDKALVEHERWYRELMAADDKVEYLVTLPWIGHITKYHLARNIGLDFAKPDRHLTRLAERFEYDDVQEMCQTIADATGERLGVVDVVLWRYCNLGEPIASAQTTLEDGP